VIHSRRKEVAVPDESPTDTQR